MHRNIILTAILLIICSDLLAQTTLPDWNQDLREHTRRSMWVLGGWGAANIAIGAMGMSRSKGVARDFHQMNIGWGAINLGLAASGIWRASHGVAPMGAWDSYEALQSTQRIFLFNAGLDVGYMMAGVWMQERAKNAASNADRWRGFGRSIVLQGAFLFVFDVGAYLYHRPLSARFRAIAPLGQIDIGMQEHGLGLRIGL